MTSTAPAQSTLAATATLDGTRSLARNAGALFAGQLVALVVPLLTVPYLARVLGPSGWGPVLAAQALGNWLVLVLEFGFDLSGTRAVARARTMPHTMSDVVHGTQSAKTLLAPAAVLAGLIAFVAIPTLRNDPLLVWCTVAFAVVRGFSPLWFFQGIERVQGAVAVDAAARAAAAPDQYRRHLTRLLSSQQHDLLTQRALLATVDRVYSESLAQIDALLPALDAADAMVAQGQHALTPPLLAAFAGWNKGLLQAALAFNASSCALSNFAQDQVPDAETQRAITLDLAAAWREFAIELNARLMQAQPLAVSA